MALVVQGVLPFVSDSESNTWENLFGVEVVHSPIGGTKLRVFALL